MCFFFNKSSRKLDGESMSDDIQAAVRAKYARPLPQRRALELGVRRIADEVRARADLTVV